MNRALVKQIAQLGENTNPLAIRRLINIGFSTGAIGGALVGIAGGIATYCLYPSSSTPVQLHRVLPHRCGLAFCWLESYGCGQST